MVEHGETHTRCTTIVQTSRPPVCGAGSCTRDAFSCAISTRRKRNKLGPLGEKKSGWPVLYRRGMKKSKTNDPGYNAEQKLKRRYGMTTEDYNTMLAKQKGKCAICGKFRKLVVDHCHTRNTVRGLLCNNCNAMLGHAGDDPGVLAAGMEYLAETSA